MSSSVATQPPAPSASPPGPAAPARQQRSLVARTLARPEIGALAAAIVIFLFFYAAAPTFRTLPAASTYLYASATIGIVAAGVAVTTSALTASLVSYQLSLNVWVGVLVSLLVALGIGFLNGYLVPRTGIPSFLVTLGTFFMLQGINLGVTKLVTGAVAT